jgi:AcrR family transcriptional regulator
MSSGLRERKKTQTRAAIIEAARTLFAEHGFDSVTVDDVANAAQVSKKTVFNYFPTKEDLVFTRTDERTAALLAAVNARSEGQSLIEAFRQVCLRPAAEVTNIRQRRRESPFDFFELVGRSAALQRRASQLNVELTATLTDALRKRAGTDSGDVVAAVVASTVVGAQQALFRRLRERMLADDQDAAVARAHRRDVNRVFDRLRDGLRDYLAD